MSATAQPVDPQPIDQGDGSTAAVVLAGARAMAPVLAGLAPLALLVGVATATAGQSPAWALVASGLVFSGGAQLALADLLAAGAGLVPIVVTGLVLNARLVAYSASFAPHWHRAPRLWRVLAALWLVDPTFAVAVEYMGRDDDPARRRAYFLGLGATLWFGWAAVVLVGFGLGGSLPLDAVRFAGPLVLVALLVPRLRQGRASVAAVAGAAAVAPLVAGLPMATGLLVAIVVGVAAGQVVGDEP